MDTRGLTAATITDYDTIGKAMTEYLQYTDIEPNIKVCNHCGAHAPRRRDVKHFEGCTK